MLETVEEGQVSLEGPTFIQAKDFDEWFLRGGLGKSAEMELF